MTFKRLLLAAALFFGGGTAAFAQCTGGSIAGCPAAVSPQPDDYLLGYQNAQNPHTRKFTLEQAAAGANTLNVGSTPISNGTDAYLLFNNNGVLGNEAVSSLNIALNQLPALTANTVLGALTATRPIELSLPSCGGVTNALIWTSGIGFGCNTLSIGGTVSTTGSPASGNLTKFSGATSITNGNLSGDATTTDTLAVTVGKVNGVTYGASPSTNTVPVVTGSNTITYETVPNAALANSSITVNGTSCTLGGSCSPSGAGGITSLTGDGTATGPGAAALTLATVNAGPGSVGSSTAIPVLTTNGKGLVTAQTTAAVVAPAGTLTGATLASNVLASSLTSVGTLAGLSVTGSFTATGLVTNADLVNAATTVNGQSCALGAACTVTAAAAGVVVGTTTVGGGTDTRVLFDNAGVLGEYTISGSGNVAMTTSPTIASPTITGAFTATGLVTNSDLVSPSVTVNGTTCTLGSSCTPQAGGIIAGTTALAGTSSRILYDNGSVVSESAGLTYDGTSVVTLGVAGASVGGVALKNATSGTVNIAPVTGALGTVTLSAPARTATLATTTGTLTNGDCAKFDASGNLVANGAACGSGSGTVTSVAQTVPGGFAIGGSPVTTTGTLAITANGTDGGVLSYTGTTTMASSGLLASNGLVLGGGAGATPKTAAGFATDGTSVLTLGVAGTSAGGLKLSGLTSGTTTVKAAATAGTTTITLPGGTTDFSATGGSNQVVKQTSSGGAFTVAALSSGDVPCAAMPALTGGVTSSAGSCATTAASVPTSAITGTVTDAKTITFDSTTAVTAQTISFPIEWTSYTITSVKSAVNGGGSFTTNVKIGSTSVTSCSAISVSGATNTVTACTAANTGSANDIINVVLSSPSGTVNQAYVSVVFTHTVN